MNMLTSHHGHRLLPSTGGASACTHQPKCLCVRLDDDASFTVGPSGPCSMRLLAAVLMVMALLLFVCSSLWLHRRFIVAAHGRIEVTLVLVLVVVGSA